MRTRKSVTLAISVPPVEDSPLSCNAGSPAVPAAITAGDLVSAAGQALKLLEQLPPTHQATARAAMDLILAFRAVIENLPPVYQRTGHTVNCDGRATDCFEQMIALLRRQDCQISELQAILADLI